jgi:hypothetical protein
MMFLDCPAYLDDGGTVRCELPAEVTCRSTMRSTDGPLEAAMIRCPSGHWFNGPIESLTCEPRRKQDAGVASSVGQDLIRGDHMVAAGLVRGEEISRAVSLLEDPALIWAMPIMISAWGRKAP